MNDEQKEWQKQFWMNFGAWEYIRFSCSFVLWMFLAVAFTLVFHNSTVIITFLVTAFLIATFAFSIISRTWGPAYNILRKILGNKNLPLEPMPRSTVKIHRQPLPWYGYLPGLWHWVMFLLLLYIIIKYLLR